MIIGLTGTIAAGKSEVAAYLKTKGFEHHTYSDILRKQAARRKIEPTRKNLQELGNTIKQESHNLGILSKLIVESSTSDNIIADGIRTVDEIKELKKHKNTVVIGLDANQQLRFERLKSRNRKGDPQTLDEFKVIDDHETKGITAGQDIGRCLSEVDELIINEGSVEELQQKIDTIMKKYS